MCRRSSRRRRTRASRTIRCGCSSARACRADVWRRVIERFAPARVLEFYASTEGDAVLVNVSGDEAGALGRPLPGSAEVRIAAYDPVARRLVEGPDGFAIASAKHEPGCCSRGSVPTDASSDGDPARRLRARRRLARDRRPLPPRRRRRLLARRPRPEPDPDRRRASSRRDRSRIRSATSTRSRCRSPTASRLRTDRAGFPAPRSPSARIASSTSTSSSEPSPTSARRGFPGSSGSSTRSR